jgi:iron complex outermembrane receptor protein
VIGGYAYVDAEVTESTTTTIPVGSRLANVPRHSFNLLDTYEFDSGALAGLGLGSTFDMDGYGLVDLLAYYPLTENVRLNLNLNNVFDKHYEERLELSGRTAHPACGDFAQPVKTGAR